MTQDIPEHIRLTNKAMELIDDLNHQRRTWTMSIPAQPDYDPDLVISRAFLSLQNRIVKLTDENSVLVSQVLQYEKDIDWQTNCHNCANVIDESYKEHERAEALKKSIENTLALLEPGPCSQTFCIGCEHEWMSAIEILNNALGRSKTETPNLYAALERLLGEIEYSGVRKDGAVSEETLQQARDALRIIHVPREGE